MRSCLKDMRSQLPSPSAQAMTSYKTGTPSCKLVKKNPPNYRYHKFSIPVIYSYLTYKATYCFSANIRSLSMFIWVPYLRIRQKTSPFCLVGLYSYNFVDGSRFLLDDFSIKSTCSLIQSLKSWYKHQ